MRFFTSIGEPGKRRFKTQLRKMNGRAITTAFEG